MQFKLGDVVRLKSGGPKMTVSELTDDGYILTYWFIYNEGPFEGAFEPEMLELAVDEDDFYDADDIEDLSDEHLDALVADSIYSRNVRRN